MLLLSGWKRKVVLANLNYCRLSPGPFFRLRLCFSLSLDALRFLHGKYGGRIYLTPQDTAKFTEMKSASSLLLTAHFHHWEAMGAWLESQGIGLLSAALPLKSPWAQAWIERRRHKQRIPVVYSKIPRTALAHMQGGHCFALLWDQHSPGRQISRFFGQPVGMNPLPAFLTRHTQAPVFLALLMPTGRLRIFRLRALGKSSQALANRYHRLLEKVIAAYPTYWYGFTHNRFQKLKPSPTQIAVSCETKLGFPVSRET